METLSENFPHTLGELFREIYQTIPEKTDQELYRNVKDLSSITSTDGFDDVKYLGNNLNFYSKGELVKSIYLRDGMVDDVNADEENLIITFNTDSSKKDILIPLSTLFSSAKKELETKIDEKITETSIDSIPNEDLTKTVNNIFK